jgi:hypothetical protein
MKKLKLLMLLTLLATVCPSVLAEEPLLDVSMIQLIANPKEYQGKLVRIVGFVRLEFEGNAIYLHKEDYEHSIDKNGLWLDVNDVVKEKRGVFNSKYALVEGVFDAKDTGHMGLFCGKIHKVRRFQWLK